MQSTESQKKWKSKNFQENKEYFANRQRLRREQFRQIIEKAKDIPCFDCNKRYPYFVMDFDHVRGRKEFQISDSAHKLPSVERLLKEISKCDVVCANCHRLRTFGN